MTARSTVTALDLLDFSELGNQELDDGPQIILASHGFDAEGGHSPDSMLPPHDEIMDAA
jgi:hypothetical protein